MQMEEWAKDTIVRPGVVINILPRKNPAFFKSLGLKLFQLTSLQITNTVMDVYPCFPPYTHTLSIIILAKQFYDYSPFPKVMFIITAKH